MTGATRLANKRIAIAGSRKTDEMSAIVERMGGIPLVRPMQGTERLDPAEAEREMSRLVEVEWDWFIFTTGIGLETMAAVAEKIGLKARFLERLKAARIAARGYKAAQALTRLGLKPDVRDEDGTTAGLVRALTGERLAGRRVALQLHGDPAPKLRQFLEREGALFREVMPYRHIPPEPAMLQRLAAEIADGELDAVAFTSAPQVHALFGYARERSLEEALLAGFAGRTVAVAVGKVTAESLRDCGVKRIVQPEEERMGAMLVQLSHYYAAAGQPNAVRAE